MSHQPPVDDVSLEVDASISIYSPVSRQFWTEPTEFEPIDLTTHVANNEQREDLFRDFARLHRIDFRAMRSLIQDSVQDRGRVGLAQLLEESPPQSGVMDVLGYLQIATDDGHVIEHELSEDVVIPSGMDSARTLVVTIPRITFVANDLSESQ